MAKYVEKIKVGSDEAWQIRDPEAHSKTTDLATRATNLETRATNLETKTNTLSSNVSSLQTGKMAKKPDFIEFSGTAGSYPNGGVIDFHYNGDQSADYTSRIIEGSSGQLTMQAINGLSISGPVTTYKYFKLANTEGYGPDLPPAGNAGRIFFKKV